MQGYFEIITDQDLAQAQALLAASGLSLPTGRTYGLGFYEDGHLAACGFLADTVLCGICVAPHAREGGLATSILSRLVLHGRQEGASHFFIFTKASEAQNSRLPALTLWRRRKTRPCWNRDGPTMPTGSLPHGRPYAVTDGNLLLRMRILPRGFPRMHGWEPLS